SSTRLAARPREGPRPCNWWRGPAAEVGLAVSAACVAEDLELAAQAEVGLAVPACPVEDSSFLLVLLLSTGDYWR
ncbi:unnamed protein product, partial [Urochloa humidicola]